MHDGISHQHHLQNIRTRNIGQTRHFLRQLLQGSPDGCGHFDITTGIHHDIGNPAHQVFTEADLRVHQARRRNDFACREIGEMCRNGGGTNIDGESENRIVKARPDRHKPIATAGCTRIHRTGDFPFSLAQGLLQAGENMELASYILNVPLAFQRRVNPLQIR